LQARHVGPTAPAAACGDATPKKKPT
jgi:hypothetical protein